MRKQRSIVKNISLIWIFTVTTPLFILALLIFRPSSQMQFLTLVFAALAYLFIAILHHLQDKSLTWEIVIEYILIAALSLLILQGLFS